MNYRIAGLMIALFIAILQQHSYRQSWVERTKKAVRNHAPSMRNY